MSPFEAQKPKPKQLDVLAQMAGRNNSLPAPEWGDGRAVAGAAVVAGFAIGAVVAPGGVGSPERADAVVNPPLSQDVTAACINDPSNPSARKLVEVTYRFAGLDDISDGSAKANITQDSPQLDEFSKQRFFGDIRNLLSPLREGLGYGSTSPEWVEGVPFTGTTTYVDSAPDGPFTIHPEFIDNSNSIEERVGEPIELNCNPVTNEPPQPPVTEPEPVTPAPNDPVNPPVISKILTPTLSLATAKILEKNRRGKLTVNSGVSNDSTCSIDGSGNGAHKNLKLRKQAARVEIRMQRAVALGRLPGNIIGLKNNQPVKKGQKANVVAIDIRNSGISPGQKQITRLNYQLLAKSGGFTAKFIVPKEKSDCGGTTSAVQLRTKSK